ncbi:uncharacterized protein E0L32_006308 [Thyridium curvatum]|uniref:Glycosyl hydrolase family 88 n=1 Tax=Thyridium curvatum TaxID=1093900 RepID=A0A507AR73_9PEZI|nr:uncharacterized protein E0L32_006308 [Thyridium curvatum]TPX13335.1 hypothetical protein E0L32_006308 [Thyridium curvatum]
MPTHVEGIASADIHKKIQLLIRELVTPRPTADEWLVVLADGSKIDPKGWNDWEWTHGVGLYGIWKYYELTGEAEWLKIIEDWFRARFEEGHKGKNINTMAVFLTLAYVYEQTRNPVYKPWLESWAEWTMHDLPRTKYGGLQHMTYLSDNDQELWDDTLVMTVLPLTKIGLVLNRPEYVAEAKRQFLLHIQYLFDTKTGLFFHGWCFNGNHNFAKALWGRGNSWVTLAIPEFLELLQLDRDDPLQAHLIHTLSAQCEALVGMQQPDGLWRTLLDIPESEGSYPESSATAGFAYGILKAQRLRYLESGKMYSEVGVKAVKGVLANISPEGELLNTSYGTAMGHDLQHYKDIPITAMPYGQAMAMMALVEFLRAYI